MAQRYMPPTQGRGGQIFDVLCLLIMVFAVLFVPVWLNIAVPSPRWKADDVRRKLAPKVVVTAREIGAELGVL